MFVENYLQILGGTMKWLQVYTKLGTKFLNSPHSNYFELFEYFELRTTVLTKDSFKTNAL